MRIVAVVILIFSLCIISNAEKPLRKKMSIDLKDLSYTPSFNKDEFSDLSGKSIYISEINSADEEEYYSEDKRIKYIVDELEDFFENWVKVSFEYAGLLIQEPPSYWQRAFQPSVAVSVNQSGSAAPQGMMDLKINITNYNEAKAELLIEGYVDGRIHFKENIPVSFPPPPVQADKKILMSNAFLNLDILAKAILDNKKFRETIHLTNKP